MGRRAAVAHRAIAHATDARREPRRSDPSRADGRPVLRRRGLPAVRFAVARGGARSLRGRVPGGGPPRPPLAADRRADTRAGGIGGPGRTFTGGRTVQWSAPPERADSRHTDDIAARVLSAAL